jgi:hypothetical protein
MKPNKKQNNSAGSLFDPIFLGELKYYTLRGIPWTTAKYGKLLFGEERKLVRKAIGELIQSDYNAYPLC